MKIKILTAFLTLTLVLLCVLCSCEKTPADTAVGTDTGSTADSTDDDKGPDDEQGVQSFDIDINAISVYDGVVATDSHGSLAQNSMLELNYREKYMVDSSGLGTSTAYYPRIKELGDGTYIMFYQNAQTGTSIYYATSKNMKTWLSQGKLFERVSNGKWYATADACVLENGDIIVVTSFNEAYNGDASKNGLAMKRSSDNGKTWSEEQIIYKGTTWEPSILQLVSGEIQVYWTNTHVKGVSASLGGRTDDNSTGTMMIRSYDNGKTWTGDMSKPYGAQIIAQQKTKKGSDGNYYSGQMPVAIQLNNGNIALALEARVPKSGSSSDSTYNLSFAYSPSVNSWQTALGSDEEGPSTLVKNKFTSKAGPYLRQFESGETLLSYHWGGKWYVMLGNSSATTFYSPVEFFEGVKIHQWGAMEITNTHTVTGVVPMNGNMGIYVGNMYLNHTLAAKDVSVSVDGMADDWTGTDQAFFVGSVSQAQTSIRVQEDEENLYFYAETLDYYISDVDRVAFYLGTDATASSYINVSVYANGNVTVTNKSNKEIAADGVEAKVLCNGTYDVYDDKDTGYVIELKIPKSVIGNSSDVQLFNPTLYNKDKKNEKAISDTVGTLSITESAKWLKISLSK